MRAGIPVGLLLPDRELSVVTRRDAAQVTVRQRRLDHDGARVGANQRPLLRDEFLGTREAVENVLLRRRNEGTGGNPVRARRSR